MKRLRPVVDLRNAAAARVRGAVFAEARRLAHGDTLTLLVAHEPSLLMHSVNLQLRGNLAWSIAPTEGGWQVDVRYQSDLSEHDVVGILAREHKRLDGLMAGFLQRVNYPDAGGLAPAFAEFASLLRRHIAFENGHIAPLCATNQSPAPDAPATIMVREHDEILRQLFMLEESIATDAREEIGAFAAILSGTLAKHEHREESNLFPRWRVAVAALTPRELEDLVARAAAGSAR